MKKTKHIFFFFILLLPQYVVGKSFSQDNITYYLESYDCSASELNYIIPADIQNIEPNVFQTNEMFVPVVYEGTYGEQFANGLKLLIC